MKGCIVSFDVSKGNCHYQGFIDQDTMLTKPKVLYFTRTSFRELENYAAKLKDKSGADDVSYVFESTGVYHKVLKKYLDDHQMTYYIISPLLSAKYRQTELHSNKTDPLDCRNIAKVYYGSDEAFLHFYRSPQSEYEQMKKLNRYYEDIVDHERKYKVTLRAYMEEAMPGYDSCFPGRNIYNPVAMEILKKWPHPELILRTREKAMISYLEKKLDHNEKFIIRYVSRVRSWAEETYPGCEADDETVNHIPSLIAHIEETAGEAEEVLESLFRLAKKKPLFEQMCSIPGIGENLAARITAELGDVSRFDSLNTLTSYAGLDPMIRQSGQHNGLHLSISKKGNRRLRCLLYLAVGCNLRLKKNDRIYCFYQRKRQQPNPLNSKVAKVATMRKLLTIIYGMSKTGEMYIYD